MILITGATGHFGKATIESLLKKGVDKNNIRALVRNEAKAEIIKSLGVQTILGDYSDPDSLLSAFNGIDKLLFISSSDMENRTHQHINVISAAKEAGVKHLIYTSVERSTDSENSPLSFVLNSHMATEKAIKVSGIDYTILRNNLYLDTLPWFLGQNVLNTGVFLPAGEGKVGFLLRSEMAEAAANILITEGHENKEYDLSAIEPISFGEIADFLSEITGKKIHYHSPELQVYIEALTNAGVPKEYAGMFGAFAEAAKQGELKSGKSDIVKILGRNPLSVKDFLKSIYTPEA